MTDDTVAEPSPVEPTPDRPPTAAEERAAERGATDVDVDRVAEDYEAAAEQGAHVEGEGKIEGVRPD